MNALDLLYIPIAALTAPAWAGKKRSGWAERLGNTPALPPTRPDARGRILLHAVSVGEVNALRQLVPLLAADVDVVVSVTTDTGIARAREVLSNSARIVRYPLDFSWAVKKLLDAVKPDVVGLVELELWPNFVGECVRRRVPVAVINGRLSARSFRGYRRIRPFFRGTFGSLSVAAVQDEAYRARFVEMGVPPERCRITGSMKWDAVKFEDAVPGAEQLAEELGIDRSRPLIVAGSTGPLPANGAPIGYDGRGGRPLWCEEAMLHAACPEGVQLLCAPRKPERFDQAAAAMPGCVRRSARGKGGGKGAAGASRFLLDSIGELRAAYSLAEVAVVGRSFGGLYGSDPVEPVALGRATVIGPCYGDFETAVEALRVGGGLRVVAGDTLRQCLTDLLSDSGARRVLGEAGRAVICEHQGASRAHAELLRGLLDKSRRD